MSESSVVNEVQEARESHLKDVREAASTLARRFDLAYWRTCDKEEKYPWEFVNAFAKAGWMGILMPEEYGGMGLGLSEAAVMLNEIAAAGAGMSGASAIHFYMFPPQPILRHGSEAMKQRYLPLLARGELLMAFGVTEPTSGVDTSRIRTKAERRRRPLGDQRPEGLDRRTRRMRRRSCCLHGPRRATKSVRSTA